jgi:hypothetical protein
MIEPRRCKAVPVLGDSSSFSYAVTRWVSRAVIITVALALAATLPAGAQIKPDVRARIVPAVV